jgi:hypothetical protein
MPHGFDVHRDHARARGDELLDVTIRLSIIRCTSSGRVATRLMARTTGGPIVMFGTKCPSMTST